MVRNLTRDTVITDRLERAETFWTRFLGLQFRASFPSDAALWLSPCSAIHTMCVRFPIDVLFLDDQHCVVARFDAVQPWRVTRPVRGAKGALEFVAGKLAGTQTQLGDLIGFDGLHKPGPDLTWP